MSVIIQTQPSVTFTDEELTKLTERIQNAGTEVVNAKAGAVSVVCVCVCVCVSVCMCLYVCLCMCNAQMCVCVCVYMYACVWYNVKGNHLVLMNNLIQLTCVVHVELLAGKDRCDY